MDQEHHGIDVDVQRATAANRRHRGHSISSVVSFLSIHGARRRLSSPDREIIMIGRQTDRQTDSRPDTALF